MTAPNAQDRYSVGLQLFQSGNFHLAEKTLRDALAIDPLHYPSSALLALTLQALGRSKEALGAANASLAVRPSVDGLRALTLSKLDLGDRKGALAAANDAVSLMPSSSWAAHTHAWSLERSKSFKKAALEFKRAADLAPANLVLRAENGRFLIRRGRLKDAEEIAASIPSSADANSVLLLRGEIALWRGRLAEARELALWVLSRNAQQKQAIILLTLATANRNPFLKLWWRHVQVIKYKPIWLRVIWVGLLVTGGMLVAGLPIIVLIYFRIARKIVSRQVRAELRQVRLKHTF